MLRLARGFRTASPPCPVRSSAGYCTSACRSWALAGCAVGPAGPPRPPAVWPWYRVKNTPRSPWASTLRRCRAKQFTTWAAAASPLRRRTARSVRRRNEPGGGGEVVHGSLRGQPAEGGGGRGNRGTGRFFRRASAPAGRAGRSRGYHYGMGTGPFMETGDLRALFRSRPAPRRKTETRDAPSEARRSRPDPRRGCADWRRPSRSTPRRQATVGRSWCMGPCFTRRWTASLSISPPRMMGLPVRHSSVVVSDPIRLRGASRPRNTEPA